MLLLILLLLLLLLLHLASSDHLAQWLLSWNSNFFLFVFHYCLWGLLCCLTGGNTGIINSTWISFTELAGALWSFLLHFSRIIIKLWLLLQRLIQCGLTRHDRRSWENSWKNEFLVHFRIFKLLFDLSLEFFQFFLDFWVDESSLL